MQTERKPYIGAVVLLIRGGDEAPIPLIVTEIQNGTEVDGVTLNADGTRSATGGSYGTLTEHPVRCVWGVQHGARPNRWVWPEE